jgi:hypothetical protein
VVVTKAAHSVLLSGSAFCAVLVALDFLDDPAELPQQTCPADMPFVFR